MTRAELRIAHHVANLDSPDFDESCHAEWYLIRYYGRRATAALLPACKHPNPTVRFRAVWALGMSKDPTVFETILSLTDDEDEGVRYDAVLALGKLGDERAIEPLCRMALALDETRPAWGALIDFGAVVIPLVEKFYNSDDGRVRYAAVSIAAHIYLEHTKDERCAAIMRAGAGDSDDLVRSDALDWLEEFGLESVK